MCPCGLGCCDDVGVLVSDDDAAVFLLVDGGVGADFVSGVDVVGVGVVVSAVVVVAEFDVGVDGDFCPVSDVPGWVLVSVVGGDCAELGVCFGVVDGGSCVAFVDD